LPRSLSKFPEYDKAPDVDQLETTEILVSHLTNFISHTNNLTHFICHITANFCSVFNLFTTLQEHSPVLQELYFNAVLFVLPHTIDSLELKLDHKRSTMISLRAVCLVISFRTRAPPPSGVDVSEFVDFTIRSCPSIVDLRLSFISAVGMVDPYPQFLLQGNWSKLSRLTLEGMGFYSDGLSKPQKSLIMRNFLSRHPTLRCLSLETNQIFKDSIAEGSLPNMQSFCLGFGMTTFDATLPVTAAANMRHFRGVANSSSLRAIKLMTRLQTCILTKVPILDISLASLLDALPVSVERISVDLPPAFLKYTITENWLDTMGSFRRLQHLTHIAHMFFFVNIEEPVDMDLMRQLGSILPGLLYVQAGIMSRWIRMQAIKEQNGEYALPSGTRIDSDDWGDIFWAVETIRARKITKL
ncbi:hypothetical protein M422DRAFT_40061, partial [Sphaerobolus stellatus SS14]